MTRALLLALLVPALMARASPAAPEAPQLESLPKDLSPQDVPPPVPADDPVVPPPAPQDTPPVVAPTPAPSPSVSPSLELDYATPWTEAEHERELTRLAEAHPTRCELTQLGTSRQGRRIALLTLGERGAPRRPSALLVSDLRAGPDNRPRGPETALFVARTLLEDAERDPALAELFAAARLYVVPAPDPDGLYGAHDAPRTCRLDRNFPAGWSPSEAADCPQGPYPCSEPETRELARFVAQRPELCALVLVRSDAGAALAPGALPGTVCLRIAQLAGIDPSRLAALQDAESSQAGSLAAFAAARGAALVVALEAGTGSPRRTALGNAPADAESLAAAVRAVLSELPRLEASLVHCERLREKLWLAEIDLGLAGSLPSASADERARSPASVWLDAADARIVRAGLRRAGAPSKNLDEPRDRSWRLGHLDGGERVRLHLVVEGASGGALELRFHSLRGGEAVLSVPLAD